MRLPNSLAVFIAGLLVAGTQAALAQRTAGEGEKCERLLAVLQVIKHPQMREVYGKPDATLGDLLAQLDALATEGNADAQYAVGRMMQQGVCAQQNTSGALEYFTRAAHGGSRPAQQVLAGAYYDGKDAAPAHRLDIPVDPVRSYMWYRVLGDKEGIARVRRRMTPSEVNEAELLAREQLAAQSKLR